MKVFAISDLHLNNSTDKPMDVFGEHWIGHWDKIKEDWQNRVDEEDIVLIPGDLSWAMSLQQAKKDLDDLGKLKGNKFIIRGNHDYWWSSYSKIQKIAPPKINFLQNNAIKCGKYIICGTRGWTVPEKGLLFSDEDDKVYAREQIRLKLSLDCAKELQEEGDEIIAMMHFPPFNSFFEDSAFTLMMDSYNIRTVVYGHLHGNRSRYQHVVNKNNTDYILTSCDLVNNTLIKLF